MLDGIDGWIGFIHRFTLKTYKTYLYSILSYLPMMYVRFLAHTTFWRVLYINESKLSLSHQSIYS